MRIKTTIHISTDEETAKLIISALKPEIRGEKIKINEGKEIIIEIMTEKIAESRAKYNTITRLIKVVEDLNNTIANN